MMTRVLADDARDVSDRTTALLPASPTTREATGLSLDLFIQLVLKLLHFSGELTGIEIARRLGLRTIVRSGTHIDHSVILGADMYEEAPPPGVPPLGIGRDVVLRRAIVDKNARIGDGARLINEQQVAFADGDGYHIRGGIIVVPKGGVIAPGTVV